MTDDQERPDDQSRPDDRRPAGDKPGSDKPSGGKPGGGKPYGGKPGGGRPYGGKPGGGKPYGGKPGGGRPYADKPGGGRPGGRPYGDKPGGGRPYGSKPGGGRPYGDRPGGDRPYRGRPGGDRPGSKPYSDRAGGGRPYGDRPRDDRSGPGARPRGDGGPPPGRPPEGGPRHERRVDYSHRDRHQGPRPQRGQWERDRGPRRGPGGGGGGGFDRRDRFAPSRPPQGPAPAEVLGEDEEIVAGRRPVEEAFAARREAKRLLVVPERRSALDQVVLHATTLRIPVVEVEGGTITAVSGFDGHQGVALVVAPRRWATIDDVLALAKSRGEPPFVLVLDHLEDPQNVGTLLRSAEACGVHGVLFPTKGAAPISPAAIKTSAGAVEHLLLVPVPDLAGGLVDLHARGLRVIGADGDAPLTVREVDMRGPIVIVTGSEGRGLNARVRKRVDLMARIPMRGHVASLNASVAGSVFLFEAATQRDLPEAELPADTAGEPSAPDLGVVPEPSDVGDAAEPSDVGDAAEPETSDAAEPEPDATATDEGEGAQPGAPPSATAEPIEPPEAEAASAPGPEASADAGVDPDDLLPEAPPAPSDEAR